MNYTYGVWTCYNGELSLRIYTGTKRQCKFFVKQALKKGDNCVPLVILPVIN